MTEETGRKQITHGGYTATALYREVPEKGTWAVELILSRGDGDSRESWLFSAGDIFPDVEAALKESFRFAREVIDRELTGCSLE